MVSKQNRPMDPSLELIVRKIDTKIKSLDPIDISKILYYHNIRKTPENPIRDGSLLFSYINKRIRSLCNKHYTRARLEGTLSSLGLHVYPNYTKLMMQTIILLEFESNLTAPLETQVKYNEIFTNNAKPKEKEKEKETNTSNFEFMKELDDADRLFIDDGPRLTGENYAEENMDAGGKEEEIEDIRVEKGKLKFGPGKSKFEEGEIDLKYNVKYNVKYNDMEIGWKKENLKIAIMRVKEDLETVDIRAEENFKKVKSEYFKEKESYEINCRRRKENAEVKIRRMEEDAGREIKRIKEFRKGE